jgi:hypothetical protein
LLAKNFIQRYLSYSDKNGHKRPVTDTWPSTFECPKAGYFSIES